MFYFTYCYVFLILLKNVKVVNQGLYLFQKLAFGIITFISIHALLRKTQESQNSLKCIKTFNYPI